MSSGVPRCAPGVLQVNCPCPIVQEGESRPWKGPAPSRCTLPHPGVPRPIQVFTCPIQVCPTPSRCAVPHPGVHCPIQVFTCPIQVCPPPIQVFIAPSRCSPAPSTSPHLTWGSGVSVQVLLLQFWVPHLSRCAVLESPHLGLRCRCPGVAAAPLWGPNSIFGVHTCLGSQVPSPSTWRSGVAEFGVNTCPGVQFWSPLTWGSGVAVQVLLLQFWGPISISGVHTCLGSQVPSPSTWGSGDAEFGVHTWLGSPHLELRCLSPGVAAAVLASTPVQVCSFGVPSPVAQVSLSRC
ncbi:hypothetical protein DV515_00018887 [Chloebia gouldiae]|uniref:Uncharacterized protein n=1 Tax=Chloebia gouldiae TaxID=44316 RepID=A0A3L8Q693_CHLGU|nr:hypothetical protein DV515_00018887 [Chloebia gouldiae]